MRVFITFSSMVQPGLAKKTIIVQNKEGKHVERGTREIYWNPKVDGPWDADRCDADEVDSSEDPDDVDFK